MISKMYAATCLHAREARTLSPLAKFAAGRANCGPAWSQNDAHALRYTFDSLPGHCGCPLVENGQVVGIHVGHSPQYRGQLGSFQEFCLGDIWGEVGTYLAAYETDTGRGLSC